MFSFGDSGIKLFCRSYMTFFKNLWIFCHIIDAVVTLLKKYRVDSLLFFLFIITESSQSF